MRKTKWIFFAYIGFVVALAIGMAVSINKTPARDPSGLYLTTYGALRTLDPGSVWDELSASYIGLIYETLYNFKYGQTQPYQIIPEIAAALPQVSPDGLTVTIPIRHGIHFYDPDKKVFPDGAGDEITAKDVIYSFKRICDFHLASPEYSQLFQGWIVGLDQWWDYTQKTPAKEIDWDKPVEGFRVVDKYTIQLKLTRPNPQLIYNLQNAATSVVSKKAVDYWTDHGNQFLWHPVGSGPYVLSENLRNQRLVFLANPVYRGKPDVDGTVVLSDSEKMPFIKRLQEDYFDEPVPAWLLFKQGYFDSTGIPKEAYNEAIKIKTGDLTPDLVAKGIILSKHTEPITGYIGFNMSDPVLGKNKALRQAMSLAFDRKTYIHIFLNDRGVPAPGPIPPGFETYDDQQNNPYSHFNLEQARQKMTEAIKFNHGEPIPPVSILMQDTDTGSRQFAEYFVSQEKAIGVTVAPIFADFARQQDMIDNRQMQLFEAGWVADYPDELDFLQLFYGKNSANTGINSTVYGNPEFDKIYEKASVMQSSPQRRALYVRMEQIVMDDCVWICIENPQGWGLRYDWLLNTDPMDYGNGNAQYLKLDEALRSKRLGH